MWRWWGFCLSTDSDVVLLQGLPGFPGVLGRPVGVWVSPMSPCPITSAHSWGLLAVNAW